MTVRAGTARVGVVGAGSMGREHLAALAELGVSAAVFSPSGRTAGLATEYDATLHRTLSDLMEHCEVVDICSPHGYTPRDRTAGLRRGT